MTKKGLCAHPDCKGKPEKYIYSAKFMLCRYHNNARLIAKKKAAIPINRNKIPVKDWRKDSKKLLDNVFSKYIRLKYGPTCFTCDQPATGNGHYISRKHGATRYNESNCKPVCSQCNISQLSDLSIFRERLISLLGLPEVLHIEYLSKTEVRHDKQYYKEQREYYENEIEKIRLRK